MTPILHTYSLRSVVSGFALVYVIQISGSPLEALETAALAVLIALLVSQLLGLSERMRQAEHPLGRWSILRNVLFWTVGLMNTLWLTPELRTGFRPWIGTVFLLIAAWEMVELYRRERAILSKRDTQP